MCYPLAQLSLSFCNEHVQVFHLRLWPPWLLSWPITIVLHLVSCGEAHWWANCVCQRLGTCGAWLSMQMLAEKDCCKPFFRVKTCQKSSLLEQENWLLIM